MGELGLNKIFGALLATALGLFGLHELSASVFSHASEGHHDDGHEEAKSMTEQMCEAFAYCVEVAGSGAAVEEEEVYDLGLLLAEADISRGERVFKGQCTTCHTIETGGANGTGPNLHNVVGASKAAHAGFSYSAVLTAVGGSWTYEDLDSWLQNPAAYARGTSMSFAGIRRDADRASLIAYLASNTEAAPAFPAPLAAEAETVEETGEALAEEAGEAIEAVVEDASETTDALIEEATDMADDAADAVESAVDEVVETVEEASEEAGEEH